MPPLAAQLMGSSGIPYQIPRDTVFNATSTWMNIGTETWLAGTGSGKVLLGSSGPNDNTVWGGNTSPPSTRHVLPNDVPPGGTVVIPMTMKSPNSNGFKECRWQLVKEYVAWFGDILTPFHVLVGDVLVSQSLAVLPPPYPSGGLRSFQVFETPVYDIDSVFRSFQWENQSEETLEIVKAYVWIGANSNTLADLHAELRRMSDGSKIVWNQFDRYSSPNAPNSGLVYDYSSFPMKLDPGDKLELFTWGQNFGAYSQYRITATIWVK